MFKFKKSSCVVVGTFNTYIIQPHWLSEVGIFPSGATVEILTDIRNPGIRFSLSEQPENDNRIWNVRPDRLSVESTTLGVDCGEPIARVLEELQWTPIDAVGCNIIFDSHIDHYDKISHLFNDSENIEGYKTIQRAWHRTLASETRQFNIHITVEDEKILLTLNSNTDAKTLGSIRESNSKAQLACKEFKQQTEEVHKIAQTLFGMEF
ncbi:hypothetical protein [Gimesia chilikensis]|uniref:hypothetical protein n=1 Tax=Gimesia chilikensis TaxID=2605989 RepID=UPI00118B1114|nr:hypothetical protein [Gimesia chilikensis]QDT83657.1 hypothetical protein MalM14_12900 [Gimesia chilikensis]